jgi:predicted AAA+ superfamily ATPase
MIYLIQLLKMMNKRQKELFVTLFNDLSYEIDELGYKNVESELIEEMLNNHFNLFIECDSQIQMLTKCILKYQGRLGNLVKTLSSL